MSLPAYAQENARYVLVLTETAAGGGEAVVATYGGRLERAIDETTIEASVSESRASLMARDPRVKSVTLAGLPRVVSASWTGGMSYAYDAAGNVKTIGTDTFVYDHADRLVSDTVSGLERRHEYDAFGNRTKCTDVSSGGDCQAAAIIGATNRITGATYDEAGDLTMYSGKSYTYDGSGMLIRDTGATAGTREYVYTADEERIAMIVDSTWYWTLRDFSGKVLREMTSTGAANGSHSNWQWTRDNVWRKGQLLSSVQPSLQPSGASTSTYHYHLDHLGTPRVVSDTSGTIIGVHDYAAFGTENSGSLKEDPESRFKFTGHERDAQGGPLEPLDSMHARYYNAMWGRFLSVDPTMGVKAALVSPQKWNRYAYVQNNPLRYIDPDGQDSLAVFLTGDESYRNVSTWDVITSGDTVRDVKQAWNDFLGDHQSMTHGMSPFPTSGTDVKITVGMVLIGGPLGGPLRGLAGTTLREAKTLIGAWGKGTFGTLAKTIAYHVAEHGEEVGAKSTLQYLRKAYEFNRNLRGAEKALLENGATRYTKNGYYIIKDAEGRILSYGAAR
jgi:RHS repeat-associated protein